ncbi:MAG: cytochrome c [Alphaproteobacteria bacterium]|nr:cytochrome c [Alphaproteobacteria bacterium]
MSAFGFGRVVRAAFIVSAIATVAVAGPAEVAQIKPRQDKLRDMGGALKAIADEIKKGRIDWDNAAIPNAQTVKDRSGYLLGWFPKGSGPESHVKTYALPAVWAKPDEFTKLGKQLQADAAKLNQVVQAKDEAGLKAQVQVIGKTCKACHDTYRSPDYEKDNEE